MSLYIRKYLSLHTCSVCWLVLAYAVLWACYLQLLYFERIFMGFLPMEFQLLFPPARSCIGLHWGLCMPMCLTPLPDSVC